MGLTELPHSNVFRVDFRRTWCHCSRFQAWRYPCAHAVATCMLGLTRIAMWTNVSIYNGWSISTELSFHRSQMHNIGRLWIKKNGYQTLHSGELQRADQNRLVFIQVWISITKRRANERDVRFVGVKDIRNQIVQMNPDIFLGLSYYVCTIMVGV